MKYLIVNADDLAITPGVTEGIIEACEYGIVRSATMFANTEHFDHAISCIKPCHKIGIGVHLTLTHGTSVLRKLRTITNKYGKFFKIAEFEARLDTLSTDEIASEFSAQIEKVKNAGIEITHLDTHHHIHKHPKINEIVAELSRMNNIGMRKLIDDMPGVKTTDAFTTGFHGKSITDLDFKLLVKKHENHESLEVMCHPGRFSADLIAESRYLRQREEELATLTTYDLQFHLFKHNIEIISFAELPD